MAMADAASIAEKWSQRLAGATTAYKEGVQRVSENPMQKAAANVEGYRQGIMDAISSGKWQAGLNRVSLQQWKEAAGNVGAQRLASGASAAKPKMMAFLQQFLPVLANNVAQVKQSPNATFEQRMARMVQMATLNHQFKRT